MWFRCLWLSVLVLLVGGCVGGGVPRRSVPVVSTIVPTVLVSESSSGGGSVVVGSSSSSSDADLAAAEALVKEYFRLKGEVQKDPNFDIGQLEAVVAGPVREKVIPFLEQDRLDHIQQVGEFIVHTQWALRSDEETIMVKACTDTTGSDMVDQDTGLSVLDPNLRRTRTHDFTVKLIDGVWKVYYFEDEESVTCGP